MNAIVCTQMLARGHLSSSTILCLSLMILQVIYINFPLKKLFLIQIYVIVCSHWSCMSIAGRMMWGAGATLLKSALLARETYVSEHKSRCQIAEPRHETLTLSGWWPQLWNTPFPYCFSLAIKTNLIKSNSSLCFLHSWNLLFVS